MAVDWQVVYLLTTTVSVLLLGAAAAYGWRFRASASGFWFAAFCAAAAGWAALVALMALSAPAWAARWLALKYLFIQLAPLALLMFSLEFAGIAPRWRRVLVAVLLVVPVVTQAVVWTNDLHHAMLGEVVFARSGMLTYAARIVFGPYYWVTVAQGYLLVLASLAVVAVGALRAGSLTRRQAVAVAAGVLAPAVANVLLITGTFPRVADPMPIGLVLAALMLWWAALAHRILDLAPVARNALVDAIGDGMLAVDAQGRVIDANAAMRAILGSAGGDPIGRPASELLAGIPALAGRFPGAVGGRRVALRSNAAATEVLDGITLGEREFEARLSPLPSAGARLLVLHDHTERRRMARQREALIAELREAVAKVRTLEGLVPMCASCKRIRATNAGWLPVDEYLRDQAGAVVSHVICPGCRDARYPRQYSGG